MKRLYRLLVSVIAFIRSPSTAGEARNADRRASTLYQDREVQPCITADAAPVRLSISRFILASLVDKTPRYLNSTTWGWLRSWNTNSSP